jgi:hypothetical protein
LTKAKLITISIVSFSAAVFADVNVPPLKGPPVRSGSPIGFVVHPAEGMYDHLQRFPANAELSNIFIWRMKDQDKQIVDFGPPAQWLQKLYASGRQGYPILDTSVFHSQGWRAELTGDANQKEYMIGADGKPWSLDGDKTHFSSLYSPVFRKGVFNYIDQLIDWIKLNDKEHRIPGYIDGAEWFMPATLDYSPLGISLFQTWLQNKYNDLKTLNAAWGSGFQQWQDAAPPRGILVGNGYSGIRTIAFTRSEMKAVFNVSGINCNWVSPSIKVEPGQDYKISAKVWQDGVSEGLCAINLICYDKADNPIINEVDGQFYWTSFSNQTWGTISEICQLPANACRVRVKLFLLGTGKARFVDPSLQKWPTGEQLLPVEFLAVKTAQKLWSFENDPNCGQSQIVPAEDNAKKLMFCLSVPSTPLPYKHTGAAWEDWVTFSYESMAGWLNMCAKHIKQRDESRQVISYVGCVFGLHTLGDFSTNWQRLDISLANSPDVNINGIQVCIADHDFTCATGPIDITRKYGKHIYATDLVDFPFGLNSGFEAIYLGALAAVQHGMDGMFYYCWYANEPKAYNYATNLTSSEIKRFIEDTNSAIEAVKGYVLQTDVAVLHPMMSYSLADENGRKSDLFDSAGLYHLILDIGLMPDIWTPYEIAKQGQDCLKKYKLLFIPDCPILDNAANQALITFIRNGGVVIGTGRYPQKDFAGNLLNEIIPAASGTECVSATDITKAISEHKVATLGRGRIYWIHGKLGRTYWGKVKRWREAGNTPSVFMQTDISNDSESLRKYIRCSMDKLIDLSGIHRVAKFDVASGNIHLAVYKKKKSDSTNNLLLFLVNKGRGRTEDISMTMNSSLSAKTGDVLIDFDRKVPVSADANGLFTIPGFAHSCILLCEGVNNAVNSRP